MKRAQLAIRTLAVLLVCGFLTLAVLPSVRAQDNQVVPDLTADLSNMRVARLSFVVGDVQFQPGQEDWQVATVNLPIQEGYKLATGNGRAEIEFESGLIVRLADNSELDFTQLGLLNGGRITQLTVVEGSVIVSAALNPNDALSITASNLQVGVTHITRFRVDTTQGDSWVTVMKGDVSVSSAAGDSRVTLGHTLHISGANPDQINVDKAADPDDFDRWAADRDGVLQQENSQAMQAVQASVASDLDYINYNSGLADLYGYGNFVNIAGYGTCWQPYGISTLWMPFWRGEMVFVPGFGWTWISNEPWGWLPYHTGRWFYAGGRGWFWQPGPARNWNPAPVNWVRVNNQLGWTPRGVTAPIGPAGIPWFVTANPAKSGEYRPAQRLYAAPAEIAIGAPPAAPPSAARSFQSGSAAPGSSRQHGQNFGVNGPARGPIHLNPETNTYENDNPPVRPVRTIAADELARAGQQYSPADTLDSGAQTALPRQPSGQGTPAPPPQHSSPPPAQRSSPPSAPHSSSPPASHGGGSSHH